jgi:formate dehydrogenase assembly factor FdhD
MTRRFDADGSRRAPDELIVEEPMSIRLDGELVATTMRTPGDDFELAIGFCVRESCTTLRCVPFATAGRGSPPSPSTTT